jgi:uncharacterized protein (TIGR03546 family)
MFILIWIRKIYKVISADASPSAIAFGVLFGLILGCLKLSSGLALFLMASVLVLRVQISSALLALAVGKGLSLLGLSALFVPVGARILEPAALHPFWTWFLNLPVVAWLELYVEAVTGGAVVGLVLGLALFFPIRQLIIAYRRFLHEKLSTNKFFRWATNFWLVKGLRFVFIGTGVEA